MTHPYSRIGLCGRYRGFSLLEMLIALVILSFSLGALYQGSTAAIRNVAIADEYTRAAMLAESMLASTSHVNEEQFLLTGTFDIYTWEASSWPTESPEVTSPEASVQALPLQYLKVTVRWPGPRSHREIALLTAVPLQESAQ